MTKALQIEVTQADRDAAAQYLSQSMPRTAGMRAGEYDDHPLVQAFARHRLNTRFISGETAREQAIGLLASEYEARGEAGKAQAVREGQHDAKDGIYYPPLRAIERALALSSPAMSGEATAEIERVCSQLRKEGRQWRLRADAPAAAGGNRKWWRKLAALMGDADKLILRLSATPSPAIPREPTAEMIEAVRQAYPWMHERFVIAAWQIMHDAAPSNPSPSGEELSA